MDRIDIPSFGDEKGFAIEYVPNDAGGWIVIDGVRCTPEVIRMIIVDPNPRVLIWGERNGDICTYHSEPRDGLQAGQ